MFKIGPLQALSSCASIDCGEGCTGTERRFPVNLGRRRFILGFVLAYLVLGVAWVLASDALLHGLIDLPGRQGLETSKALLFVLLSDLAFWAALRALPAAVPGMRSVLDAQVLMGSRQAPWRAYALAIVLVVLTLLMRYFTPLRFEQRPMLILFMLPVIVSALVGGLGPGLLSTVLAEVGLGWIYFASPVLGRPMLSGDALLLGLLAVNGVAVSLLSEWLQRALRRLQVQQRLLDAVVSGTTDAVFVKDVQGRYLLVNESAAAFVGRPVSEILGQDDQHLFPAESARQIRQRDRLVMADGQVRSHEEPLRMPSGQDLVFGVTKGPVLDRQGQVIGLFGISRDITGQKRQEAALRESQQAMQTAQQMAGIGNWTWDLRSGVHTWSEQIHRIYGHDPQLPPVPYPEVGRYFEPASWSRLSEVVDRALAQSEAFECDAEVVRSDGEHRWITARGDVVRDAAGQMTGWHGTVQDITERKLNAFRLERNEERLRLALDAASDGLWDWDVRSDNVYRSARYYQVMGTVPEEDQRHDLAFFLSHVHADDRDRVVRHIDAHREGRSPQVDIDFRIRTHTGEPRWVSARGRAVERDAQGEPLRMVGTLSDITVRKELELAQRQASTVFDSSYEGIMVVSPDGLVLKINQAFTRITGYEESEIVGQSPRLLHSGQQGEAFYRELWEVLLRDDIWRGELVNRRKNGETYTELLSIAAVRDGGGLLQHFVGVFTDISQLKSHEAELDRMANFDQLTGLPNRRLLSDRLAQALAHADRGRRRLAVCYLDLDGFKVVNDRFGHAAGDQLLVHVSAVLKQCLRADDTLARLGGDEFVLLLADLGSVDECRQILARVLDTVGEPLALAGHSVAVSASIGACVYPDDEADADTLLRHADQAMYLAKEAGKNRLHVFDPENDRQLQAHRRFLERFRQALADDELVLHYQPKVDLRDGGLRGVEALIRWQHPERGLLQPGDFLPQVLGGPMDPVMGAWVIRQALAQAAAWQAAGLDFTVSVNVSGLQLLQAGFVEQLAEALAGQPGVPPQRLELEVLESGAIADLDQAIDVMRRCRDLGVQFSLDDFGTGYSTLTYLRKLPVDTLKIDRSFVRDMLVDPDDLGIVDGVVRLAGAFRREVIAEGVETLAHGAALLRLGCPLVQGYAVARPMPAAELLPWWAGWRHEQVWERLTAG